jgi:hypothetical protein
MTVPASMQAGQWELMVHTIQNQLMEQPVKLTME